MTSARSEKPADVAASNRLRKHAQFGNPRRLLATTFRPAAQVLRPEPQLKLLGDIAPRVLDKLEETRR